MRTAILADIHGNFEALKAVSGDMEQFAVDRVVCLGDNVGYGPEPDEVVTFIRTKGYESVLGNHEFALKDQRGRRWLNFQAAENNQLTGDLLSHENLEFSSKLPLFLQYENGYFVHGFPKDSVFRYLQKQNDERVLQLFEEYESSIFFVGHSHELQLVFEEGGRIVRSQLGKGKFLLDPEKKYIVNCGSVGQPRDGNKDAKYVLWDSTSSEIEVRSVPYNVQKTIDKIKKRGFPDVYGLRL
jgi:predicted phosphodiesterase